MINLSGNHEEAFKRISKNIKNIRIEKNMTQQELAERAGISLSYLSKIEEINCNKSFSLHVLFDIADALGVDVKKLL